MPDEHFKLVSRWHQNLDPRRVIDLSQEDGRDKQLYVELDAWRHEGQTWNLRGPPAVVSMFRAIRLAADEPEAASAHLFSGFRGTGKTTELSRLTELLREKNFTVLRVSARKYHNLSRALSPEEFAVLLAAGIGEAALELVGETQLVELRKRGVWERISGSLKTLFSKSELVFKFGVADLKPALFQGAGLKQNLGELLGDRPDQTQAFLHDFVRDITEALHPRQLVVLVDDLEKYDVPTDRVAAVYEDMKEIFFSASTLLKLPCHVVYTVPPYVALLNRSIKDKYDGNLYLLPSVKLRSRPPERLPFAPGISAYEALLAQRVDLDRLFGDQRERCLERLIVASGGNLRDLFSLLRGPVKAALDQELPVGLAEAEASIRLHAGHFRLTREPYELVRDIRRRGVLLDVDTQRQRGFADALDQRLLLCYWNGDFWYDSHPLIEPQLDDADSAETAAGPA